MKINEKYAKRKSFTTNRVNYGQVALTWEPVENDLSEKLVLIL